MWNAAALALSLLASEPVIVTQGIYQAPGGVKLELIGVANSTNKRSEAVDANGRPLTGTARREFELYAQQKLSARPWTDRAEKGQVVLFALFKVSGPKESQLGVSTVRGKSFRAHMERYSPPEPKKGRIYRSMAFEFSSPARDKVASIPLELPGGPYRKIASFTPEGETEDADFECEVETGSQEMIQMTKGKTTKIKMDMYRGSILAPMAYRGHEFNLTVSDAPPREQRKKGELGIPEIGGASEEGVQDGKLMLRFFGSFVNRPGKERMLILEARPQLFVTFRVPNPK